MNNLIKTQAEEMIISANNINPGVWVKHSRVAALTAYHIAENCQMDKEKAYIMGLLHDIGRREGVTGIRHIFDGYDYLRAQGFEDIADICLTHSFPIKDINTFHGIYDCDKNKLIFLQEFFAERTYDDYDRLIQLCDAIALPHGVVMMEKRLVDVVMRHGIKEFTQRKWKAYFDIKKYFDEKAGANIYTFLPNIRENTFAI